MSNRLRTTAGLAALGAAFGMPAAAHAQQQAPGPADEQVSSPGDVLAGASVRLTVDGMVCPFCAYGLEQRLVAIPSVDAVLVRVSDGLVQIRAEEGQQVTDEALQDAVKKSGFALREIERVVR